MVRVLAVAASLLLVGLAPAGARTASSATPSSTTANAFQGGITTLPADATEVTMTCQFNVGAGDAGGGVFALTDARGATVGFGFISVTAYHRGIHLRVESFRRDISFTTAGRGTFGGWIKATGAVGGVLLHFGEAKWGHASGGCNVDFPIAVAPLPARGAVHAGFGDFQGAASVTDLETPFLIGAGALLTFTHTTADALQLATLENDGEGIATARGPEGEYFSQLGGTPMVYGQRTNGTWTYQVTLAGGSGASGEILWIFDIP